MSEKSIPSRSTEAGANILQGRGGQAIIQDVVGNILLTTQNKTGSDQQILSVNDSISSIALLSGETPTSIDTKIEFPSDNFNTINWEQTPIGRVQVIQPVYDVTSSVSLDIAKDIIPTSSVSQSVNQQEEQQLTSIEEQLLFLPDNETQTFQTLTDSNIVGIPLIQTEPLSLGFTVIEGISFDESSTPNVDGYTCGKIKNNKKTFKDIFVDIVNNFEGGYFSPLMYEDGRLSKNDLSKSKYKTSGETLFGIDRKQGSKEEAALKFWKYVDSLNPNGKSKWKYLSHGPENNRPKLYELAAKILEPDYIKKWNNIPSNLKKVIESDGRLHTALAYGIWNGALYYNKYIELITIEYNNGVTNSTELLKKHIEHRKNVNKYFPRIAPHAKEILKKGGFAIEKTTGLNCSK